MLYVYQGIRTESLCHKQWSCIMHGIIFGVPSFLASEHQLVNIELHSTGWQMSHEFYKYSVLLLLYMGELWRGNTLVNKPVGGYNVGKWVLKNSCSGKIGKWLSIRQTFTISCMVSAPSCMYVCVCVCVHARVCGTVVNMLSFEDCKAIFENLPHSRLSHSNYAVVLLFTA